MSKYVGKIVISNALTKAYPDSMKSALSYFCYYPAPCRLTIFRTGNKRLTPEEFTISKDKNRNLHFMTRETFTQILDKARIPKKDHDWLWQMQLPESLGVSAIIRKVKYYKKLQKEQELAIKQNKI